MYFAKFVNAFVKPGNLTKNRFCNADFVTPSDERRSCSKIVLLFNVDKKACVRKFKELPRQKILGILQLK